MCQSDITWKNVKTKDPQQFSCVKEIMGRWTLSWPVKRLKMSPKSGAIQNWPPIRGRTETAHGSQARSLLSAMTQCADKVYISCIYIYICQEMYTKSETEPKWPFCNIFPISEAATLQPCFGGHIAPNSELAPNLDPALESSWASIWQSSMHLFENLFQYACESDKLWLIVSNQLCKNQYFLGGRSAPSPKYLAKLFARAEGPSFARKLSLILRQISAREQPQTSYRTVLQFSWEMSFQILVHALSGMFKIIWCSEHGLRTRNFFHER